LFFTPGAGGITLVVGCIAVVDLAASWLVAPAPVRIPAPELPAVPLVPCDADVSGVTTVAVVFAGTVSVAR
jgi:hypothetical protein